MQKILEIGTGSIPYFIRYQIPWNVDDEYTGIDIDQERLLQARANIKALAQSDEPYPTNPKLLIEDAINIYLPDTSFDKIFICNTLTAPIHETWNKAGTNIKIESGNTVVIDRPLAGDESEIDLFYRERLPVLKEALRLLKPGGQIIIYTDLIIYGIHSFERLMRELADHPEIIFEIDTAEQNRINELNKIKVRSPEYGHYFKAEVLPESLVFKFYKK
ncbi:MAG: class I SAM-dependent methyltransferase [bacterium]